MTLLNYWLGSILMPEIVDNIVDDFKKFAVHIPKNVRSITEAFWIFAENNIELRDMILESEVRQKLINDGWPISNGSLLGYDCVEKRLGDLFDV